MWLLKAVLLFQVGNSAADKLVEKTGTDNPFAIIRNGQGLPWGNSNQPYSAFGDIDGDGDLDMIVGDSNANLLLWKNTGSSSQPVFSVDPESATTIKNVAPGYGTPMGSILGNSYFKAKFIDMDGDGDLDIMLGSFNNKMYACENQGDGATPNFIDQGANTCVLLIEPPYQPGATVPGFAFGDLDGDGKMEVITIVGTSRQPIQHYKQTGLSADMFTAPTNIMFTKITGPASPFDVSYLPTHQMLIFALPSDSAMGMTAYTDIELIDIDGDGDLDLISGAQDGYIQFFENTGTATAPKFPEDAVPQTDPKFTSFFPAGQTGRSLSVSFGDLNGDRFPDLVTMSGMQGFLIPRYFASVASPLPPSTPPSTPPSQPPLYPPSSSPSPSPSPPSSSSSSSSSSSPPYPPSLPLPSSPPSPPPSPPSQPSGGGDLALGVGLGVGLGVPCICLCCICLVLLAFRRKRRQVQVVPEDLLADVIFDKVAGGFGLVLTGKPTDKIILKDLCNYMLKRSDMPLTKLQELFTKIDTNKDGHISRQEWRAGFKNGIVTEKIMDKEDDKVRPFKS